MLVRKLIEALKSTNHMITDYPVPTATLCSNKDYDKRDQIIFGEKYNSRKYIGSCRSFEGMSVETLRELVNEDFVNVRMRFNDAPTLQRFLEYEEKHENAIYCGYAIFPDRQNPRITIDFPQSARFQNYPWRDQSGFQRRIGS